MQYHIQAPDQKTWDPSRGVWDPVEPYDSAKTPNGAVLGVKIVGGAGETDNPHTAVEFVDMGYAVTPDPHPAAQELALAALERRKDESAEDLRAYEVMLAETNRWRVAHHLPELAPREASRKKG